MPTVSYTHLARKVAVQPADKPLGALLCRLAAAALTHEREHPAPHAGEAFLAGAAKAQILRRAGEDLLALRLAKAPFERCLLYTSRCV